MAEIFPIETFGITEDGRGFFKGNAVLLQIGSRFAGIPREHINVYTISGTCESILTRTTLPHLDYVD